MSYQKKLKAKRNRRKFRVTNCFKSKGVKPRVSVFRSSKQIYAQIIDDSTHSTLASFSSLNLELDLGPTASSVSHEPPKVDDWSNIERSRL